MLSEWSCAFKAWRRNTQYFRPEYTRIFVRSDGLKPKTVDIGVLGHGAVSFGRLMSTFRGNLLLPIFKPTNSSRALALYSHLLHTRNYVQQLGIRSFHRVSDESCRYNVTQLSHHLLVTSHLKADSHIACRAHAVPLRV